MNIKKCLVCMGLQYFDNIKMDKILSNTIVNHKPLEQSRCTYDKFTDRIGITSISAPQIEKNPMKFGKNRQKKATSITIHTESNQNPQSSGIRTYCQTYKIHTFQDRNQNNDNFIGSHRDPSFIFYQKNYRPIAKTGDYSDLRYQSNKNNTINYQKQEYQKPNLNLSPIYANQKVDPIIHGQPTKHNNTSLKNVWKQQRRHRDNGVNTSALIKSQVNLQRRYPLNVNREGVSYKERYILSKKLKQQK